MLTRIHRVGLLAALALAALPALGQNVLDFGATYEINGAFQVEPRLIWATTPNATSCTASGDWSGSKAVDGEEQRAGTITPKSWTLQCSWPGDASALFQWTPVTVNDNATPYTNPGVVRIKYTFNATGPTKNDPCTGAFVCVDVDDTTDPRPTSHTVTGITTVGTMRSISYAISADGIPGAATAVAAKVFSGAVGDSKTVVLNFPSAPGNFTVE